MRVLVNVLPVTRGGGLQNVKNLWRAVGEHGREDDWLFVARDESDLSRLDGPVSWRTLERVSVTSFPHRLRVENLRIPQIAKEWGADLIFTPMGAGPLRSPVPTVVGWHDPSPGYPESPMWDRVTPRFKRVERLRRAYSQFAVRKALRVCVQTETMARRLSQAWGLDPARMRIVSNGLSAFHQGQPPAPQERSEDGPRIVLVIGNAKPNKNLEAVPAVAHALAARGVSDVQVHVTQSRGAAYMETFESEVLRLGPSAVPLLLIGEVPHDSLGDTLRRASVVFLPSLLESFSQTYLEAMHYGVPLVTSDIDFAREICGGAALYADPLDPEAGAAQVERALNDQAERARLRAAGFARVPTFPLWEERFRTYRAVLHEALTEAREGVRPEVTVPGLEGVS